MNSASLNVSSFRTAQRAHAARMVSAWSAATPSTPEIRAQAAKGGFPVELAAQVEMAERQASVVRAVPRCRRHRMRGREPTGPMRNHLAVNVTQRVVRVSRLTSPGCCLLLDHALCYVAN